MGLTFEAEAVFRRNVSKHTRLNGATSPKRVIFIITPEKTSTMSNVSANI
jgi:hypothetical protein